MHSATGNKFAARSFTVNAVVNCKNIRSYSFSFLKNSFRTEYVYKNYHIFLIKNIVMLVSVFPSMQFFCSITFKIPFFIPNWSICVKILTKNWKMSTFFSGFQYPQFWVLPFSLVKKVWSPLREIWHREFGFATILSAIILPNSRLPFRDF